MRSGLTRLVAQTVLSCVVILRNMLESYANSSAVTVRANLPGLLSTNALLLQLPTHSTPTICHLASFILIVRQAT